MKVGEFDHRTPSYICWCANKAIWSSGEHSEGTLSPPGAETATRPHGCLWWAEGLFPVTCRPYLAGHPLCSITVMQPAWALLACHLALGEIIPKDTLRRVPVPRWCVQLGQNGVDDTSPVFPFFSHSHLSLGPVMSAVLYDPWELSTYLWSSTQ